MKQLDPKYILKYFLSGTISLIIWIFLVGGLIIGIIKAAEPKFNLYWPIIGLCITCLIFIPLIWLFAKWTYHFYRYELGEKGFQEESGIIWKVYNTIPYGRIQHIDIYRGVFDRILGLSCLYIRTAGITYLPEGRLPGLSTSDAEQLREELLNRVNKFKSSEGI